jgi:hypothetical protein
MNTHTTALSAYTSHQKKHSLFQLSPLVFALWGIAMAETASALSIDLDTTSLSGTDARFEFSLFDGDLTENNSVTITSLSTDGSLLNSDCTVSCTGAYTVSDKDRFGQFLQDVTLGTRFHFDLGLSNLFAAGADRAPDRLAISLLNPDTNFSLLSTNLNFNDALPVNDALLTVDFTGAPAGFSLRLASATNPAISITAIPSPATWTLMLPWTLWLAKRAKPSRPAIKPATSTS